MSTDTFVNEMVTTARARSLAPAPERDRRCILAMAGEFYVDFRFDETVAIRPGYELREPYRETVHELVIVIEDSPRRIVLQHVLTEKGHIIKHWRQDWEYEQTRLWRYAGDRTWERRELTADEARGRWSQTVWQVDDSPRYAGIGMWTHFENMSEWTSDLTWRPLPRREHTTRSDYDVIVGINRQALTPAGWVHEQDNFKLDRLGPEGNRVLVRERGLDLYQRVTDFDFTPVRAYWDRTKDYWAAVREGWTQMLDQHPSLKLKEKVDGRALYEGLFRQAMKLSAEPTPREQLQHAAREILVPYLDRDSESYS